MSVQAGDVVRIVAEMSLGVIPVINVFHFKVAVDGTADDDDFMTRVAALLDTLYAPLVSSLSTALSFDQIIGQNITRAELMPSKAWPVITAGTSVGHILPRQAAACVFFRTLRPKTRASKFFGGFTENDNDLNGALSVALTALLQTLGNSLVASLADGVIDLDYGPFNQPLNRFTLAISAQIPALWRTQKGRVSAG